jgi:6-phosphogluconolactonase/glucosamine-6-phosphate isomerase/deaminase
VVPVPAPAASPRLTITPPVIAAARGTLVIAAGDRKATAVRRALRGEVSADECPARLVREGRWLLDRAAAGELGGDR